MVMKKAQPTLYRWEVYASDGRGLRSDRRSVVAATSGEAVEIAAKERGWRAIAFTRASRMNEAKPNV